MVVEEVAAEGRLGSLGAKDAVGGGAQLPLPCGIGLDDAGGIDNRAGLSVGTRETHLERGRRAGGVCLIIHGGGDVRFAADEAKQQEYG